MDDIDRAAGIEHRCRRILGMNIDGVEKAAQVVQQLGIAPGDADRVLAWATQTEVDRAAQNIRRSQLFKISKIRERLDVLPIQTIAREIDTLNTAGRRLRGEFFLAQVNSADSDISTILMPAIDKHIPQISEHHYLDMCEHIPEPEFRRIARQVYELMDRP